MCCFVQETHSDSSNERDWRRRVARAGSSSVTNSPTALGWESFFSRAFSPQSVELHHVLPGHALMVKALYEKADLTLDELHVALMSLADGKAPGIDGIPVEFYKAFWPVVGEDMLEALPREFPEWFFTSELDYKVLSKALALRLREVMAEVVHVDQTLLCARQAILVNFFWDRLHWLPQAVLFLPKEEGGQGLVHLASRGAAFRLQFIQRLLYGPQDLVWRPLAQLTLRSVGGLGLQESVFLIGF
ncbi:hypothetical protein L3Q82_003336 [Scortum barcoo]|uniref:Uncharacterized protein n=1 Tax=Scortum barcoo TaxID=214431 RepID=A0ACB8VMR8_9TELE|nr:hypothetical protein L3Q82_003336 [Scortum barcoo]